MNILDNDLDILHVSVSVPSVFLSVYKKPLKYFGDGLNAEPPEC